MAQVQVTLTATIELTIDLPDSKLKSLIVDQDIDFWEYINIDVDKSFASEFKKTSISEITIDVDKPEYSSNWIHIEKRDGTELTYDGYKLTKV